MSLLTAPACSLTSDELTCDFQPTSDGYDTCGEWDNTAPQYRTTIETLCRGTSGSFSTGKKCPTANRVGACFATSSDGDGTTWYYASDKVKTVADVDKKCEAGQTLLDATGKEVERGSGMCSAGNTDVKVMTFKNGTGMVLTMFVKDTSCNETNRGVYAVDEIKGLATHTGDVWVARAGDSDPTGAILDEIVVTDSMFYEIK